jgi:hypothetical protein
LRRSHSGKTNETNKRGKYAFHFRRPQTPCHSAQQIRQ